jgi:hypothetical protein
MMLFYRAKSTDAASPRPARSDPGQATTEYALVLIGAAVIALLIVAWATDGGGAGRIGELFESVLSNVLSRAETIDE